MKPIGECMSYRVWKSTLLALAFLYQIWKLLGILFSGWAGTITETFTIINITPRQPYESVP